MTTFNFRGLPDCFVRMIRFFVLVNVTELVIAWYRQNSTYHCEMQKSLNSRGKESARQSSWSWLGASRSWTEVQQSRISKYTEIYRNIQKYPEAGLKYNKVGFSNILRHELHNCCCFFIHIVYFTCITSTCSNQTEAFVVQSSTFGYGRWRTIQIVYSICITSTCRSQTRLELSNAVFHRKHRAFDTQALSRHQLGKNNVSSGHVCTTILHSQLKSVNLWDKVM